MVVVIAITALPSMRANIDCPGLEICLGFCSAIGEQADHGEIIVEIWRCLIPNKGADRRPVLPAKTAVKALVIRGSPKQGHIEWLAAQVLGGSLDGLCGVAAFSEGRVG